MQARCWACSRHPSAAAQHSFDVRTALHGSVLSALRQALETVTHHLTFNGNLGQRKGLALPLRPTAVPPDRSAPPSRPAGKFCDGLPLALARCNTTGACIRLGDDEFSERRIDSRNRHSMPSATMWLRSCDSKPSRRSSCIRRVTRGSDPFVRPMYQLLTQRSVMSLCGSFVWWLPEMVNIA